MFRHGAKRFLSPVIDAATNLPDGGGMLLPLYSSGLRSRIVSVLALGGLLAGGGSLPAALPVGVASERIPGNLAVRREIPSAPAASEQPEPETGEPLPFTAVPEPKILALVLLAAWLFLLRRHRSTV